MLSLYRLPNQLPGEKVLKVLRRDYFILFKKILFFLMLSFLPMVFFFLFSRANPALLSGSFSYPAIVLSVSAYYLFIWLFFFFSFIDYYLDVWIITSHRIIDVKQQGFFSRVVAEQKLDRVQDVSSEMKGFFPTVLKYGEVYAQTAGAEQKFFFHEIPDPEGVRDMIIKLADQCRAPRA